MKSSSCVQEQNVKGARPLKLPQSHTPVTPIRTKIDRMQTFTVQSLLLTEGRLYSKFCQVEGMVTPQYRHRTDL